MIFVLQETTEVLVDAVGGGSGGSGDHDGGIHHFATFKVNPLHYKTNNLKNHP